MNEDNFDPIALAHAVALDTAPNPENVGEYVTCEQLGNGVTDFRFAACMVGYEGWQWSVTLFHDEQLHQWTVDESSLLPTDKALLPPKWIPWKDRLQPTDLSVTDSIGTEPDDPRLQSGLDTDTQQAMEGEHPQECEDIHDAVQTFELSRRHVMSELGKTQTAQRWYEGPHGPKSLSTKTADGNLCSTCGFLIPLAGQLDRMFGVCANRWSPDDGKVVSYDHGCGEHSEIEPPEPSNLWIQTKPALDNVHIDIVEQSRDAQQDDAIELIEQLDDPEES